MLSILGIWKETTPVDCIDKAGYWTQLEWLFLNFHNGREFYSLFKYTLREPLKQGSPFCRLLSSECMPQSLCYSSFDSPSHGLLSWLGGNWIEKCWVGRSAQLLLQLQVLNAAISPSVSQHFLTVSYKVLQMLWSNLSTFPQNSLEDRLVRHQDAFWLFPVCFTWTKSNSALSVPRGSPYLCSFSRTLLTTEFVTVHCSSLWLNTKNQQLFKSGI